MGCHLEWMARIKMYRESFKKIGEFNADNYLVGQKIKIEDNSVDKKFHGIYKVILDFKKGKNGWKYFINEN